jgi:hypothetical protein
MICRREFITLLGGADGRRPSERLASSGSKRRWGCCIRLLQRLASLPYSSTGAREAVHQPADAQEAARALGLELIVLNATNDEEIDQADAA